jgi:hypothetical protein
LRLFERGVDTATRNNVTAYGYSVSITAAFALLQTSRTDTGVLEIFAFAVGAVIAFALIAGVASGFFQEELEDQSSNVKALAERYRSSRSGLALGGRVRRGDTHTRHGSVASQRVLDDDRVCSGGRGRVGRSSPNVR